MNARKLETVCKQIEKNKRREKNLIFIYTVEDFACKSIIHYPEIDSYTLYVLHK